jgi:hypothetical protein
VFTTIRRYRIKLGQADQAVRLAEGELLPIVSAIPGFVAYQALVIGPQCIASVSTYRDRGGADSANKVAADWVERRLASVVDCPADVTMGEVRILVSSALEQTQEHAAA